MAQKIYTKTGDGGKTSLIGGTKVSKSHLRIESYGTVDELNSFIGLCIDLLKEHNVEHVLAEVQDRLFTIGSALAVDPQKEPKLKLPDLKEDDVIVLEREIDSITQFLPPMKSFVLPVGHQAVSTLHVARCVCRRAERICVRMEDEGMEIEKIIIKYLNRLSDYLFMLARLATSRLGVDEMPWKPRI